MFFPCSLSAIIRYMMGVDVDVDVDVAVDLGG